METKFIQSPAAYSNWASLALQVAKEKYVIAVVGSDSVSMIRKLLAGNNSGALIFGSTKESDLPYFANRYVEGKTLVYICSGTFCMAPVESVEEANRLISDKSVS